MEYFDAHTHGTPGDAGVKNIIYRRDLPPEQGWFSIGIHPWFEPSDITAALDGLMAIAIHPRCVAIGEFGFDALHGSSIESQRNMVKQQLAIAEHFNKPIILHVVKAFDELSFMKKSRVKKLIHGFNKTPELASQLVRDGFHLSFGNAFFQRRDALETLHSIPFHSWLIETDDQMEVGIASIYEQAAKLLGYDIHTFALQKSNHAFDFFNLPQLLADK